MKKYPIVTLCGSTKFKDEFYQIQKELTLKGYIVISVGLFGHSGDAEVWDNMDEGSKSQTKNMLDDMHKSKIDMADGIFVVNPGGYIGDSTWSEICYANMLGKHIKSMEAIDRDLISELTKKHIDKAEELAWQQLDVIRHSNGYYNLGDYVFFVHNGKEIVDPWISVEAHYNGVPWADHEDPNQGVEPFKYYGNKKMARFIESIVQKEI